MSEEFRYELRRRRTRLALSQPQFAAVLDIPASTLTDWESGKHKPSTLSQRFIQLELDRLECELLERLRREHPEVG